VFIIARTDERGAGYVAYMRAGWARGFKPLRTFRDKSDRVFRSLDKLVDLLRNEFQYRGEISLFVAGDEDLRRFRGLLPADLAALGLETPEKNTSETEAGDPPRSDQT
jgi:hypothetical protein